MSMLKQMMMCVAIVIGCEAAIAADATSEKQAAGSKPDRSADEKAIRATADEFVKAFNAADANAIGALWAPDAKYTNEWGQVFQGRSVIKKLYTDLFKKQPGATITVTIESTQFLGPDIAIEKGISKLKSPSGNVGTGARYTVVHARRNGKWTMVVVRDDPYVPESKGGYLSDLGWLIGDWRVDANDRNVLVKFEWLADKNFIRNMLTVTKDGQSKTALGQIIGYNPILGRVVSWQFDSEGGFGNDVWVRDGAKWVIEANGVFRNGSESYAVNVLTPIDANSFTWRSIKRTLDGVSLPDVPPVKIVRVQSVR